MREHRVSRCAAVGAHTCAVPVRTCFLRVRRDTRFAGVVRGDCVRAGFGEPENSSDSSVYVRAGRACACVRVCACVLRTVGWEGFAGQGVVRTSVRGARREESVPRTASRVPTLRVSAKVRRSRAECSCVGYTLTRRAKPGLYPVFGRFTPSARAR